MVISDQIKDEKLQYDISWKSCRNINFIDKYEYLTGKEILPSNQKQITEQAKFTYSPLEKVFEKHIKTIEDQGKKQIKALENLKPKKQRKAIEGKLSIQKEIYLRQSRWHTKN